MRWQEKYPFAYHVFPLHLARSIWGEGALLSKRERASRGWNNSRPTTANVDEALGFDDVVHFYLPKAGAPVTALPILATQMAKAVEPPFPHAVIRAPTSALSGEFYVCCWNIAVSRPKSTAAGVKGGNWARGTAARRIAEVWDKFKGEKPDTKQARGHWVGDKKVPVLRGRDVQEHVALLGLPKGGPELLIPWRAEIRAPMSMIVFGERDERILKELEPSVGVVVQRCEFAGYAGAPEAMYIAIERYLNGENELPLDFDRVRRRDSKS